MERKCRVCGCTDARGCLAGCGWVEEDLCSECGPVHVQFTEAHEVFRVVMYPEDLGWGEDYCEVCEIPKEWFGCFACGGSGEWELYEEDPVGFEPGDTCECQECDGMGGWLECPRADQHEAILAQRNGKEGE
jgi:hypothetical protein